MRGIDPHRLPSGWQIAALDEILDPTGNVDPKKHFEEYFDYIDIEAVDNTNQRISSPKRLLASAAPSRARKDVQRGDVIFSLVRPYLKNIAIVGEELNGAIASTAFIVCRPNPSIDARFLFNFLRQNSFIEGITTYGDSPPAGHDDEFIRLQIPVAPVREQERIADALDELLSDLDAGVEALLRARAKLALYRASVLKAAVQGDLTAEWRRQHPDTEPASILLTRILAERRQRWEQEQLRKFKAAGKTPSANWKSKYKEPVAPGTTNLPTLPKGWCWASVDQLCEVGTGATPNRGQRAKYYDGGSISWVTSSCVNEQFVDSPNELVTENALAECNLTVYPPGTLLLAMYGEGKTRGMHTELRIHAATNQAIAALQTSSSIRSYLRLFLAKNYQDVRRAASGGVQPNLNLDVVRSIALPLPPQHEQSAIAESAEDQLSVIEHLEADLSSKIGTAGALRQSILRHAFTGQLVLQDPKDEPASELLRRIAAERAVQPTKKKNVPRKRAAKRQKREK